MWASLRLRKGLPPHLLPQRPLSLSHPPYLAQELLILLLKTPNEGVAGKERKESLKRKEKVYTPSVKKYFKKLEKPQLKKSIYGEGGWEEIGTQDHKTSVGVGSSQKMKICANPVAPSLLTELR